MYVLISFTHSTLDFSTLELPWYNINILNRVIASLLKEMQSSIMMLCEHSELVRLENVNYWNLFEIQKMT